MYYQRSRRKNRHQNAEELKNISSDAAERLPSRSQSAHLTDEQVEQVLSAIRAAKSSTDLSRSTTTTTTSSTTTDMRSRSSSRPPPPSTPPPPLPKSKIHHQEDATTLQKKEVCAQLKCSRETLQNLPYFMYKKTHVVFFVFHFVQL